MNRKRKTAIGTSVMALFFIFSLACICLSFILINRLDRSENAGNTNSADYDNEIDENNPDSQSNPDNNTVEDGQNDEIAGNFDSIDNENQIIQDESEDNSQQENTSSSELTTELPAEVTPFRFALSGDSSPMDKTYPQSEEFISILKQIKGFEPDFYISTGDVVHGHTDNKEVMKTQLNDFLDTISILNCNFFISPGDNDLSNEKLAAYYKELINKNREFHFYFQHKGVYFIILSSMGASQQELDDQFLWLENLLKDLENQKVFLFIHKPVYSYMYPETDEDNQALASLIHRYRVDAVFSGHEHLFHQQKVEDTTFIISGCSGSMPYVPAAEGGFYHYLIINVSKDSWNYHVFNLDGELYYEEDVPFN